MSASDPDARASYSTAFVARRLGVSVPTVQRWVDAGHLKAWKTLGGHRRIDAESAEQLFRSQALPADGEAVPEAPAEALRVVVVDDNPNDRDLLTALVEEALPGAVITVAENGFQGLVAIGRLAEVPIHGKDYPTADGTGVRDYIHVMDLAQGHERALARLDRGPGVLTYNLGTGRGYSVLEMVAAFERASNRRVPYRIGPRRPGDIAACYADPSLAREELGWTAALGLDQMCEDAWRWQVGNPKGYGEG